MDIHYRRVTTVEFKNNLSRVLDEVARGSTVYVTRNDHPIVKMTPVGPVVYTGPHSEESTYAPERLTAAVTVGGFRKDFRVLPGEATALIESFLNPTDRGYTIHPAYGHEATLPHHAIEAIAIPMEHAQTLRTVRVPIEQDNESERFAEIVTTSDTRFRISASAYQNIRQDIESGTPITGFIALDENFKPTSRVVFVPLGVIKYVYLGT